MLCVLQYWVTTVFTIYAVGAKWSGAKCRAWLSLSLVAVTRRRGEEAVAESVVHQKLPEGHLTRFRVRSISRNWAAGPSKLDMMKSTRCFFHLPCTHDSSHVFWEIFLTSHRAIHKSFHFPFAGNVNNFPWFAWSPAPVSSEKMSLALLDVATSADSWSCNVCKLVWLSFNYYLISSSCSCICISSTIVSSALSLILTILVLSVVLSQSSILLMKFKILLTTPAKYDWVR